MPKFKTKQQLELETLKIRAEHKHSAEEEAKFAVIKATVREYVEYVKQTVPTPATVEEFYAAARKLTSAELRQWALDHGIPEQTIAELAPNFLALLADANRFGYSWDDMFRELEAETSK